MRIFKFWLWHDWEQFILFVFSASQIHKLDQKLDLVQIFLTTSSGGAIAKYSMYIEVCIPDEIGCNDP